MRGKVRTIDPSLDLGLHELANSGEERGSFRFQLKYAKAQTEDILSNLDDLIESTRKAAPMRTKDFCLNSMTNPPLTHEEDKWEREMYRKWGPKGLGDEYIPVCKRIQTYQYPLQDSYEDKYWGKIDLLGIGTDFLPVPNELKKRQTNESPLRMLVEAAAYGIAIRKVWPILREHWVEALSWFEGPPSQYRVRRRRPAARAARHSQGHIGVAAEAGRARAAPQRAGLLLGDAGCLRTASTDAPQEREVQRARCAATLRL
jgi:hypothetical protein